MVVVWFSFPLLVFSSYCGLVHNAFCLTFSRRILSGGELLLTDFKWV